MAASADRGKTVNPARPTTRPYWTALAATYLAALVLSPWLEDSAFIGAGGFAVAVLLGLWLRSGRPFVLPLVAGSWAPFHLFLLGTGGSASPAVPMIAVWLFALTDRGGPGRASVLGGFGCLLLLGADFPLRQIGMYEVLTVLASGIAGLAIGAWTGRLRSQVGEQQKRLDRIAAEAEAARPARGEVEASRRLTELARVLQLTASRAGARRAVLWDLVRRGDRIVARCSSGGLPKSARLSGNPLEWAAEEGLPLRLEEVPDWAGGAAAVCAVPATDVSLPADRVLTLEYTRGAPVPELEKLSAEAVELWSLLRLHDREAEALAGRQRAREVIQVLGRLPQHLDLEVFANELCESAMRIGHGTGAAAAVWEGDVGRVLAVAGGDGGPEPGQSFTGADSEFALVGGGVRIVRQHRAAMPASLPVATVEEKWNTEPTGLAVFPLEGPQAQRIGVLAVWTTRQHTLDNDAVDALDTLSRYAALLLQHSREFSEMRRSAEFDKLTGLHNRAAFDKRMSMEAAHTRRYRRPAGMIILDLDHFKRFNDDYGHEAGDSVLRAVGAVLAGGIRDVDFAARIGGEEFAVLLPETNLTATVEAAERLRSAIAEARIEWQGRPLPVRASVGVSAFPECVPDAGSLMRSADGALYTAKREGRDRVRVAPQAAHTP